MTKVKAYATQSPTSKIAPFEITRRTPGAHDVAIEILYCGVCHSDIHQARDEWGGSIYPLVPGHEIVGRVISVGSSVTKFKAGDLAGVGCFVDSCRECPNCVAGEEQFCNEGASFTYSSYERDKKTPTYGGYSKQIVVDENYTLSISPKLSLEAVAPLLCAGITTYSPLKYLKVTKGTKVGVVGLGGLGHMGVKFAASFGAEVTVLSTSSAKKDDAIKLGAHKFICTKESDILTQHQNYFDVILNTVSAQHEYGTYLNLLNTNGTMAIVGVPPTPSTVAAFNLIAKRRSILGSLIGGIRETQEMLDYCAEHNIVSDIELIKIQEINEAYERIIKGDVRYRFVIDIASSL